MVVYWGKKSKTCTLFPHMQSPTKPFYELLYCILGRYKTLETISKTSTTKYSNHHFMASSWNKAHRDLCHDEVRFLIFDRTTEN